MSPCTRGASAAGFGAADPKTVAAGVGGTPPWAQGEQHISARRHRAPHPSLRPPHLSGGRTHITFSYHRKEKQNKPNDDKGTGGNVRR